MKRTLLFLLLPLTCIAQTPTYSWSYGIGGIYDDQTNDICEDQNGNSFSCGTFQATSDLDYGAGANIVNCAGAEDAFIIKSDPAGNYLWSITIGGANSERANGMAIDPTGNFYVTGLFGSTVDFDPGSGTTNLTATGNSEFFIAKYDNNGNLIWAIDPGGSANNYCAASDIVIDSNGDVVICGSFTGTVDFDPSSSSFFLTGQSVSDWFVAKYTGNGTFLWAKAGGASSNDAAASVAIGTGDHVIVTGSVVNAVDMDPGPGAHIINNGGTSYQMYILDLDPSGNLGWVIEVGDLTNAELGYGIETDVNGNIIVTGYLNVGADFDPGPGVQNLITPYPNTSTMFLAKYTSSGQYIWAFIIPSSGTTKGINLDIDDAGDVAVTGWYLSATDFDPGPGSQILPPTPGGGDAFLAKYSSSGNYIYAFALTGSGMSIGNVVRCGINNGIYWGGLFGGIKDFDPGVGTMNMTDNGKWDTYTAHYYEWGKTDIYQPEAQSLNVFVDPFTGELICQMGEQTTCNHICVTDMLGRVVYKDAIGVGETRINTVQWQSGSYLISVVGSDLGSHRKVIITH